MADFCAFFGDTPYAPYSQLAPQILTIIHITMEPETREEVDLIPPSTFAKTPQQLKIHLLS
jgi:hypothetical protein